MTLGSRQEHGRRPEGVLFGLTGGAVGQRQWGVSPEGLPANTFWLLHCNLGAVLSNFLFFFVAFFPLSLQGKLSCFAKNTPPSSHSLFKLKICINKPLCGNYKPSFLLRVLSEFAKLLKITLCDQ